MSKKHYTDASGATIPAKYIAPYDKLKTREAEAILKEWADILNRLTALKKKTAERIALVENHCSASKTLPPPLERDWAFSFRSFDGLIKIEREKQVRLEFDERLGVAQRLIEEALGEMTDGITNKDIVVIAREAFKPRKSGKLDRARIHQLCNLKVNNAKWKKAVDIIRECEQAVGTRVYFRVSTRPTPTVEFVSILLDMATIQLPLETPAAEGGAE